MLFSWKAPSYHGEVMRGKLCSKGPQRPVVALGTLSESEKESGFKWKQRVVFGFVAEIRTQLNASPFSRESLARFDSVFYSDVACSSRPSIALPPVLFNN